MKTAVMEATVLHQKATLTVALQAALKEAVKVMEGRKRHQVIVMVVIVTVQRPRKTAVLVAMVAINDHHQKATLTVALLTRVVMVGAQMEGKDHQQELMVVEAKAVITFLMEAEHHHHQEVATVVATTVLIMVAEVTVVVPFGVVIQGNKQISASSITRAMNVIISGRSNGTPLLQVAIIVQDITTLLIIAMFHLIPTEDTTMHH